MAPVMHKFMDVMTGDKRRRALLGPDEIDQEEGENSGKCGPRKNLAVWDWKRPGCRSMDKASHVLPYRVSHLRAPFGKRRPCESGEDAGKTHPRGGCTVCQRGESLGGGCVRMVGGRGVRGRQPGVVGVAVASSSRRIVNRLFSVCGATVGSPIARVEPRAAWHSPRAVQGTQDWTRVSGAFQSPGTEEISLYVGTGASVPPKRMSDGTAFSPV
jgi:hypothetical protein